MPIQSLDSKPSNTENKNTKKQIRKIFIIIAFASIIALIMWKNSPFYVSAPLQSINGSMAGKLEIINDFTNQYSLQSIDGSMAIKRNILSNVTRNTDGKIRVIIGMGCSGSTNIVTITKKILEAHGFKIYKAGAYELFKPHKNKFFETAKEELIKSGKKDPSNETIILKSFSLLNQNAIKNGQVLVMKLKHRSLIESLNETGTALFAHMYRNNILDRFICEARDCFFNGKRLKAYPVVRKKRTYERTDLCMDRRKHRDIEVKVKFSDISILKDRMNYEIKKRKNWNNIIKPYIAPSESQESENLFAFEYTSNETVFESSVRAWESFLKSFDLDINIISMVLRPKQNTRSLPKSHDKLIQNFYEVKKMLNSEGLGGFLRIP